jgi:hypothetical protein
MGAKGNRVLGIENAVLIEAEGTRTLNLRIDSPGRGFVSVFE